ncbi:MAG: tetratricopeptide repeat protein [Elusimicrobia bacterium]|nr:tetratricopeptide repeat protein [Elusimicrobiota bacterium]
MVFAKLSGRIIIYHLLFALFTINAFAYYSFEDAKTIALGGSVLSSPFSNPALICEEERSSFYGEYSDMLFNLSSYGKIPGYYSPDLKKEGLFFTYPQKVYSFGFFNYALKSSLHREEIFKFSIARNVNDFFISRFEDRINISASFGIYQLEFFDFPYEEYSSKISSFFMDFSIFSKLKSYEYGFCFKNAGPTDIGISRREKMPQEFVFSFAKRIKNIKTILTLKDLYTGFDFGFAIEGNFKNFNFSMNIQKNSFGTGFGFNFKKWELFFGGNFISAKDIVFSPSFSLRYFFKPKPKKSKIQMMKEFYNLAYQNYRRKNYKKAIYYWDKVLEIDPNHVLSRKNIKKAKVRLKKYYFAIATQEFKKGNYEKAIEFWKKVLEIDPEHELSKRKIEKARKRMEEGVSNE